MRLGLCRPLFAVAVLAPCASGACSLILPFTSSAGGGDTAAADSSGPDTRADQPGMSPERVVLDLALPRESGRDKATPPDGPPSSTDSNPGSPDAKPDLAGCATVPAITSVPNLTVSAGQTYVYAPTAVASGPVTWSLILSPPTMTVDAQSGLVIWPSAGPPMTAAMVVLRASCANKLYAEQVFSISVL